jgi:di/tricarboxylate transporter
MPPNRWTSKYFIFFAAIVAFAVVVAIGLVHPAPVQDTALGQDWHCSRLAFVWITCSRVIQKAPSTGSRCKQPRAA